jgi:hypothetical protein
MMITRSNNLKSPVVQLLLNLPSMMITRSNNLKSPVVQLLLKFAKYDDDTQQQLQVTCSSTASQVCQV